VTGSPRLRRNFFILLVGNLIPIGLGVWSVPWIIERAGLEVFSILSLLWLSVGYVSFLDLGIGVGLTHKISLLREKACHRSMSSLILSGVILSALLGGIGAGLLILIAEQVASRWNFANATLTASSIRALQLGALCIPFVTLTSCLKGIAEGFELFSGVSLIKALFGGLSFLLPALCASQSPDSIVYMAAALLASRVTMFLAFVALLGRKVLVLLRPNDLVIEEGKGLLTYSAWVTVSNLCTQAIAVSDRFLLATVVGVSGAAYFSVPFDALARVLIVPASLVTILLPYFSGRQDDHSVAASYREILRLACLLSALIFLPVAFFSNEILEIWIDSEFSGESKLVFSVLSLGFLFVTVAHLPLVRLQAAGFTKAVAIFHFTQFIIYVPVFYLVIIEFGVIGGAVIWSLRAMVDAITLMLISEAKVV